jgi:hypothetical protein
MGLLPQEQTALPILQFVQAAIQVGLSTMSLARPTHVFARMGMQLPEPTVFRMGLLRVQIATSVTFSVVVFARLAGTIATTAQAQHLVLSAVQGISCEVENVRCPYGKRVW